MKVQRVNVSALVTGIRAESKRTTSTEKRPADKGHVPTGGDAVIIKSEEKNGNLWKLGIVEGLIRGRDGATSYPGSLPTPGASGKTPISFPEPAILLSRNERLWDNPSHSRF